MGHKLGMTRSALSYMSRSKTFSDARIGTELGYAQQVSRDEGLAELRCWAAQVGGAARIWLGRRRGEHRALVAQTHAYFLREMVSRAA